MVTLAVNVGPVTVRTSDALTCNHSLLLYSPGGSTSLGGGNALYRVLSIVLRVRAYSGRQPAIALVRFESPAGDNLNRRFELCHRDCSLNSVVLNFLPIQIPNRSPPMSPCPSSLHYAISAYPVE